MDRQIEGQTERECHPELLIVAKKMACFRLLLEPVLLPFQNLKIYPDKERLNKFQKS